MESIPTACSWLLARHPRCPWNCFVLHVWLLCSICVHQLLLTPSLPVVQGQHHGVSLPFCFLVLLPWWGRAGCGCCSVVPYLQHSFRVSPLPLQLMGELLGWSKWECVLPPWGYTLSFSSASCLCCQICVDASPVTDDDDTGAQKRK